MTLGSPPVRPGFSGFHVPVDRRQRMDESGSARGGRILEVCPARRGPRRHLFDALGGFHRKFQIVILGFSRRLKD
jgi:hypothetical protein